MLTAALTAAALLTSVFNTELQRVDPVTLAPAGAAVRLDGQLSGSTSRGSKLALGVSSQGRVQIVNGRASRVVRTGRATAFWLLSWPREQRLVALGTIGGTKSAIAVVDPSSGRVLRNAVIDGRVMDGIATEEGMALIVAPESGLADASLVLIDAAGTERRIALAGLLAGSEPPGVNPNPRDVKPGVAIRDGRAYVATDSRVVEVDLASGEQRAHAISGARASKRSASQRWIAFVGPHQLAVSGSEISREEVRPAGLRVVDIRTWGARLITRDGQLALPLPRGGFVSLPSRRSLELYDAAGDRVKTALRGRSIVQVQVAGRYAYAVTTRPRHRTFVVELSSGRVVKTLPTAQPGRLLG